MPDDDDYKPIIGYGHAFGANGCQSYPIYGLSKRESALLAALEAEETEIINGLQKPKGL